MKIKLTEQQAKEFARLGGTGDFNEVDQVSYPETLYKDFMACTTICKQASTGKFFAIDWSKYVSHYGPGSSEVDSTEIYEVEEVEKVKVTKEWKAV